METRNDYEWTDDDVREDGASGVFG